MYVNEVVLRVYFKLVLFLLGVVLFHFFFNVLIVVLTELRGEEYSNC